MKQFIWILFASTLLYGFGYCEELAPIVHLNGGKVRGIVQQSDDGHKVLAYQGIRYGRASRFSKPQPVDPWTDVYNATHWRDACPQTGFDKPPFNDQSTQTKTMSEDCLFVSVWKPAEEKTNRTVMFWIHGGSFEHGTIFSTLYDGRYLASRDVIVVTVNYRLGSLGFLYGGIQDAPGNLALHDQILALKWVNQNIHHFGGDPAKVTIFGESAGAFSISAFIMSPLTKGLFQRAIEQSGAPNSLTTNEETKPQKRTETLAKLLHCPTTPINQVLGCLRNKTVDEILNAQNIVKLVGQLSGPVFGDEILPLTPMEALKSGKINKDIDFLYGVTRDEGSLLVPIVFPELNSNETVLTINSTRNYILKVYASSKFATEIADFYTKNLKNPSQTELRLLIGQSYADPNLICSTILFGEAVAKLTPTKQHYSYRLTQPTIAPFPILGGCAGWRGVCHGEDVVYLFGLSVTKSHPADYALSKDMISAWTSFAKTGHPGKMGFSGVEWTEAVDQTNQYTTHMNLDSKHYQMVKDYFKENCNNFWKPKIFS